MNAKKYVFVIFKDWRLNSLYNLATKTIANIDKTILIFFMFQMPQTIIFNLYKKSIFEIIDKYNG